MTAASQRALYLLTMGCLQLGASLINLPSQGENLAYYYPHAGDSDIYCARKQIGKKKKKKTLEAPHKYLI